MKILLIVLVSLVVISVIVLAFFYVQGRKIKRRIKDEKKIREYLDRDFEKEKKQYLKENLSVPGVTKSSDFHKKYNGKKRYQKANPEKKFL